MSLVVNQLQRVAQARTRLVECMPFFGRLTLYLSPRLSEPSDNVSSMAVGPDGTLVIDEEFCESLADSELTACLVHEVLHVALLFWGRLQNRMVRLFNAAQDHAINHIIHESEGNNISLPSWLLLNPDFAGMSAEEIYDVLFKRRKSDKLKNRHMVGDCRLDLVSTEQGKRLFDGEIGAVEKLSATWRNHLVEAATFHEKCKGRGSLPAGIKREIGLILNSKESWVEAIRAFVAEFGRRSEYSFRMPSRRSETDLLPSRLRSGIQLVVLIDTSSSITKEFLTLAVSEINGMCDSLGITIRVIVIDADIQSDVEVSDVSEIYLSGNGGSDFNPAFSRLEQEHFSGTVIAFTDGDISVPRRKPESVREVLWVIGAKNKPPTSKWGSVVRLS